MKALRAAIPVVVGTRLPIFFVGYLAVVVFGYANGSPPVRDFPDELRNLPSRFDARWYVQIAKDGYSYDPKFEATVQQNINFFPAFPMTMRAVARPIGRGTLAYFFSGTILSLAAFAAALAYLSLLASEFVGEDRSGAALWLLAAYPFAFFYGAIYSESFFLLETVAAFFHFRRGQFGRAAIWGCLAGLTRPNGFLLAIPLFVLAVRAAPSARASTPAQAGPSMTWFALAAAVAPLLGVAIYSLALWRMTGNPLAWATSQLAWGHEYRGVGWLVADRYRLIKQSGVLGYVALLPQDFLNGLAVVFVLVALWPVGRRLGLAYVLWILINTWPSITTVNLISAGRYTSVLFPIFIWLAGAIPPRHLAGWMVAFGVIQALGAAIFYTWRPLY